MPVTLPRDMLFQYRRFSLYNSPFVAHDEGRAIDLYPEGETAPSPVAGEVVDVQRVRAPPEEYAAEHDWLVLVEAGEYVARIMHVDPVVEPGGVISVGDPLGELVRAGFFAPWVPNHVHLEFRDRAADPYRASGSEPLAVDVDVEPLTWDGTGTVVESEETWVRLDAPAHPAPGDRFVGLANDVGDVDDEDAGGDSRGVLDGGMPHYDGGGLLFGDGDSASIAGTEIGSATGRAVDWDDLTVRANGEPVTGVALFCARDEFGVKLVGNDVDLPEGMDVRVTFETEHEAP